MRSLSRPGSSFPTFPANIMPTYDYECRDCGQRFEVFQSMNDPRLEACLGEGCHGTMKRLIGTGAGIIFKGSGFYETDYRSASYKAAAKKDSESGSASATKTSDSKGSGTSSGSSGTGTPSSAPASPSSQPSGGGKASSQG